MYNARVDQTVSILDQTLNNSIKREKKHRMKT